MSSPVFVTRTVRSPSWLILPPITSLPASLSTGRLSPVRRASSTDEKPSLTTPSAANGSTRTDAYKIPGNKLFKSYLYFLAVP